MSRIRSVHPGLFTDPEFVMLSDAAQVFFIGLWTVADDNGAFAWQPLVLKMKLRPAALHPVEPLLEELLALGRIRRYEHDGMVYGLIRNFARYQHPKAPRSWFPIPTSLRRFAAIKETCETSSGENFGNRPTLFPPDFRNGDTSTEPISEINFQNKEKKEEKEDSFASLRPSLRSGLSSTTTLRSVVEAPPREREGPPHQGENKNLVEKGINLLGRRKRTLVAKMLALHGPTIVNNALDDIANKSPDDPTACFISACQQQHQTSDSDTSRYGPITKLWEGGARAAEAYIKRHGLSDLDAGDKTPQSLLDRR